MLWLQSDENSEAYTSQVRRLGPKAWYVVQSMVLVTAADREYVNALRGPKNPIEPHSEIMCCQYLRYVVTPLQNI
jgi:hypothetical protein